MIIIIIASGLAEPGAVSTLQAGNIGRLCLQDQFIKREADLGLLGTKKLPMYAGGQSTPASFTCDEAVLLSIKGLSLERLFSN